MFVKWFPTALGEEQSVLSCISFSLTLKTKKKRFCAYLGLHVLRSFPYIFEKYENGLIAHPIALNNQKIHTYQNLCCKATAYLVSFLQYTHGLYLCTFLSNHRYLKFYLPIYRFLLQKCNHSHQKSLQIKNSYKRLIFQIHYCAS